MPLKGEAKREWRRKNRERQKMHTAKHKAKVDAVEDAVGVLEVRERIKELREELRARKKLAAESLRRETEKSRAEAAARRKKQKEEKAKAAQQIAEKNRATARALLAGNCERCLRQPKQNGRPLCKECGERRAKADAVRYQVAKALGLCCMCNRSAAPGLTRCEMHRGDLLRKPCCRCGRDTLGDRQYRLAATRFCHLCRHKYGRTNNKRICVIYAFATCDRSKVKLGRCYGTPESIADVTATAMKRLKCAAAFLAEKPTLLFAVVGMGYHETVAHRVLARAGGAAEGSPGREWFKLTKKAENFLRRAVGSRACRRLASKLRAKNCTFEWD